MASHIVPKLLDRIRDKLVYTFQTNMDETYPIYADTVKIGRFQENPNKKNVYIAVQSGDPEDLNFVDGIVSLDDFKDIDMAPPPREIGGGEHWWRRGVVQYGCFFNKSNFSEEVALEYAYELLGYMQKAMREIQVADLVDDYGEQAYYLFSFANTFTESGGPPKSYIWRGRMYWQCLTEQP